MIDQTIEQEIQAKGLTQRSHVKCQGDRCMSINGRGHSRECIQEAARVQGWTPSEGDFSECGPSAPITESTIEQEIEARGLTSPCVTPADIEANIASTVYFTAFQGFKGNDDTDDQSLATCDALRLLTFCVLVLRNGFTVTGESACVSPENFDAERGRKIARANAVQKMWPLMGYALKEQLSKI